MKILSIVKYSFLFIVACVFISCSEIDLPEHMLDVEYRYELTCSDDILNFVTPEVSFVDARGNKKTFLIESGMWEGDKHKKWSQSVHYDSINVSNSMTVRYIAKHDLCYHDYTGFDNTHDFNCLILILEDGNGRRNNFTIIPDNTQKVDLNAEQLEKYIQELTTKSSTRGGVVDINGEISKIDNN